MTIETIKELVLDGKINPLEAAIYLRDTEKLIKDILEAIKPSVLNEIEKYNKECIFKDRKFVIKRNSKYDLSTCNHPQLIKINKLEQSITEEKKALIDYVKSIKSNIEVLDNETGEVVIVNPIVPTYENTFAISTIKK